MLKRADLQQHGEFYYTGGLSFEGPEETSIVLGNNFDDTQALRTKQRKAESPSDRTGVDPCLRWS